MRWFGNKKVGSVLLTRNRSIGLMKEDELKNTAGSGIKKPKLYFFKLVLKKPGSKNQVSLFLVRMKTGFVKTDFHSYQNKTQYKTKMNNRFVQKTENHWFFKHVSSLV